MMSVRKSLIVLLGVALVACATEPRAPGVLWLTFSTKLGDELPFSWDLSIDDGSPHTISSAVTGALKFDSLSAGAHRMKVTKLPTNCSTGNDDREIDIPSGDTLLLSFQVTCQRVTGDVAITVSTNGVDPDADGYILLRDGQPIMALPPLESVTRLVAKLAPGTHLFSLSGVASNCSVDNGATSAFVTAGKSVLALLGVNCVAVSGNLRVNTTTTGSPTAVDPSGYIVTAGSTAEFVPTNGTTLVSVPAGSYTVSLTDIEPNCTAAVTQQSAAIAVGSTTEVSFEVACGAYPPTTAGMAAIDPAADTLPNQAGSPNGSFDIVGVTTSYASSFMTIAVRFTRAIGTETLVGYLDFDTDENPATGVTPFVNSFGGNATQGVDAFLSFQTGAATIGIVSTLSGGVGLVRTTVEGDSVRFIIPYERLNGDDGNLTITGIIGTPDRPTDLAPNSDVLVSRVPASASVSVSAGRRLPGNVRVNLSAGERRLLASVGMTGGSAWAPPRTPR